MHKKLIAAIVVTVLTLVHASSSFAATTDITKTRLDGSNRYETAISISDEFAKGEAIENCILGRDDDYADSISIAPFSAYKNAPILLTQKESLNSETKDQLAKLKIKNIYIIGDTGVISQAVQDQLIALGYNVTRYGGADRYATNKLIVAAIPQELWGPNPKIINSEDWIQGMSMAMDTKTLYNGMVYFNPIFLVSPSASGADSVKDIATVLTPTKALWETRLVGLYEPSLDSNIMANALKKPVSATTNLSPKDAIAAVTGLFTEIPSGYGSTTTIANVHINNLYSELLIHQSSVPYQEHGVLLARGDNFIDSLTVSALAAKRRMPIVMANASKATVFGKELSNNEKYSNFTQVYDQINSIYYIGGQSVIPDGSESFLSEN